MSKTMLVEAWQFLKISMTLIGTVTVIVQPTKGFQAILMRMWTFGVHPPSTYPLEASKKRSSCFRHENRIRGTLNFEAKMPSAWFCKAFKAPSVGQYGSIPPSLTARKLKSGSLALRLTWDLKSLVIWWYIHIQNPLFRKITSDS